MVRFLIELVVGFGGAFAVLALWQRRADRRHQPGPLQILDSLGEVIDEHKKRMERSG